ncbi:hypothetical protein E2C01_061716 [Portunus trituberculatus]|uniref:Uncharacterized protein n=1 Tax=Portunus trituberculatus TaxID=210409 RepID=A0A5B7HCL4_PORTR|nr:hypothetical protein [Portunus trituberculatus]
MRKSMPVMSQAPLRPCNTTTTITTLPDRSLHMEANCVPSAKLLHYWDVSFPFHCSPLLSRER